MKAKYVGALKDFSGYGEAARHDVGALNSVGIELTTQIPVYTPEASDYGRLGQIAVDNENRELGYKIKIIHTTPNVYTNYMEPDKYHVGRAFWETDKIPFEFAQNLNLMDEIWTGSLFNEQAMRIGGVNRPPIYIIPEAIDDTLDINSIQPYLVNLDDDIFKFYSIFEWTERKNPKALLEAYWKAFEGEIKVALLIKTYVDNFGQDKKDEIDRDIKKLKLSLGLKSYAPVYLFRDLMTRNQVYRFHKTGDCFISLHRGEGWGVPQMEAMLMEKPIISTNCGGIHEYLTDKKNAHLIEYTKVPVINTRNKQWYTSDQKWAEVNITSAIDRMRYVFANRDKNKIMGKKAGGLVKAKFGLNAVGNLMKKRLQEIQDTMYSEEI